MCVCVCGGGGESAVDDTLTLAAMFLLTWPYVEHHNLRVKLVALAQSHYPGLLQKIKATYSFLKTLGRQIN